MLRLSSVVSSQYASYSRPANTRSGDLGYSGHLIQGEMNKLASNLWNKRKNLDVDLQSQISANLGKGNWVSDRD